MLTFLVHQISGQFPLGFIGRNVVELEFLKIIFITAISCHITTLNPNPGISQNPLKIDACQIDSLYSEQ